MDQTGSQVLKPGPYLKHQNFTCMEKHAVYSVLTPMMLNINHNAIMQHRHFHCKYYNSTKPILLSILAEMYLYSLKTLKLTALHKQF